ncbi:MAG TPA: PTS sugar transporter subunit IIA [Acidobacteriota bacterium]|nr:PTS sugar transporter subunit IIA [Acidobacteriota bacterium]
MNLSRYLTENAVKLEMTTVIEAPDDGMPVEKWRQRGKELIIKELVDLLEGAYRIGNRTKLVTDFINRERKATTGIGKGVAVPHIRSMQAKDFMLGFARSGDGYDFGATDSQPTHLFFVMAAPPYDDSLYLKAFRALAEMLQYDSFRQELMTIKSPGEVIRAMRGAE